MLLKLIQLCALLVVDFSFSQANNNNYPGYWAPPSVNLTRGRTGIPGKRGPPGPPGSVSECNCTQSNKEFRRVFGEVQNLMNRLQGEFGLKQTKFL